MKTKAAVWLLLGWLACACGSDQAVTEIVLVIDSDWTAIERVEIDVDGFEGAEPVDVSVVDDWFPRTLGLLHSGGPMGPIDITVRAFGSGDDPLLIEPRTDVHFVRNQG